MGALVHLPALGGQTVFRPLLLKMDQPPLPLAERQMLKRRETLIAILIEQTSRGVQVTLEVLAMLSEVVKNAEQTARIRCGDCGGEPR
jgi:hypothetical protein